MADIMPRHGIHRAGVSGRVTGIGRGSLARGGAAIKLNVRTAQAHSMLARFQHESAGLMNFVTKLVAERVKKNMEERVERQSMHSPRMGKGGGPRSPKNILRPSAGGDAIHIIPNQEFFGRRMSGYTVYVSSGQAHLLEYGVDSHWQRMQ